MALLLQDDPVHAQLVSVETFEAPSPIGSRPGRWAGREHAERLQDAGIGFLFADEVLREVLDRTLRRYAADFLGIQETRLMLEQLEGKYGELIKEVLRILPLQRIAEALRLLVSEGVSIRNRRGLLESMVEWGSIESDAGRLTEHLRAGLARLISHQYADRNRVISAFVLAPALEEQLRATLARQERAVIRCPMTSAGPYWYSCVACATCCRNMIRRCCLCIRSCVGVCAVSSCAASCNWRFCPFVNWPVNTTFKRSALSA